MNDLAHADEAFYNEIVSVSKENKQIKVRNIKRASKMPNYPHLNK